MASPTPSQQIEKEAVEDEVSFRFCRECSNMLYPKEDRQNNRLMFACRTCTFSEPAPSHCVWRNHLTNTVSETAGVTTDVGTDPTVSEHGFSLGHHFCLMCGDLIVDEYQPDSEVKGSKDKFMLCANVVSLGDSWDIDSMSEEEENPEKINVVENAIQQ